MKIELHSVVEIAPEYFPEHPDQGPDEDVQQYWRRMLDWAGFRGVQPVSEPSWDVRIPSLGSEENLRILAAAALGLREDASRASVEDLREVEALYGGLNLVVDGAIRFGPACCGRLWDVGNWIEASRLPEGKEMRLSIGDESLHVKAISNALEISDIPKSSVTLSLPQGEVRRALEAATGEIIELGSRLIPIVRALLPEADAVQIAEHLIGRQDAGRKVW